MLNAGMRRNAVAMNIGCSTRAIRHLRQCFQLIGRTEDRTRRVRPCVTGGGGGNTAIFGTPTCAIVQTVTATAANTHGRHNNRISAQAEREGGLSDGRIYMYVVFGATPPR